nr:type IV toxin-antitoxin system AbiEi family antitoxin domain-containing protein [Roseateles albus]
MLAETPRGQPLTTAWLAQKGLTAKHAARLAKDGWLRRIGHGVYGLPGDTLERDASLASLGTLISGLHIGGKTALNLRGFRHNLTHRETISLWGDSSTKLPAWFTEQFPAHYQATHLFDAETPMDLGIAPLPVGRPDLRVSTPERAILELLSDVGKRQALEEAKHLVESARMLRTDVLEDLLSHLTRIKVVRLAHAIADELALPWTTLALKHSKRIGGGDRWVNVGRTGDRLTLSRKK